VDQLQAKQSALQKDIEKRLKPIVNGSVEERWRELKDAVINSATDKIGFKGKQMARKPWITKEMISKMEERREWKRINTAAGKTRYKQLNNELRRETDKAKEEWWGRECHKLEELERSGRADLMYAKVKELTKKNTTGNRSSSIKDSRGNLLTEPEEIRNRWKEYVEVLYDKNGKPSVEDIGLEEEYLVEDDYKGPKLLESEIRAAIKEMKQNKAVGVDEIPAEFWKVLGDGAMNELIGICCQMYEEGVWPTDFTRVIMIPLQKKSNAVECGDHRTISHKSHASKIILKVLTKRIEAKS